MPEKYESPVSEEDEKVDEETESEPPSDEETETDADADVDADAGSESESDSEDESDDDDADDESDADDDDEDESDDEDDARGATVDELLGKDKPKKRKKKKTGRKKKAPKSTAGQRLAAAKAAKAAKKAAARGKQAELVEDEAAARADKAAGWLERNRGPITMAALALLALMGGWFAYESYAKSQAGDASTLLWEATQTLNAPLGDEEDPLADEESEDAERYETIGARADAALEKLDALLADYGSTDLAPWAQVLRGRALYQKGEHEAAREAFGRALSEGGADVRPRALEGIAFTFEAEEAWDEAIARFEELRSDDDPALSILADYHIARVHIARDNEEEAKEKLQAVLDALREEDAPELGYVRDQAELRLMAIDSSLVQRSTPDQDEMRRLIEQLQRQQATEGG